MMSMSFECKDCDYKNYSQFYRKYVIEDGEKVYLGHPGDGFATNAIEENPYIHKETHVIEWFEKDSEIPEGYERHYIEMILFGDSDEKKFAHVPFCPKCKKELKLLGFIGCM